MNKEEKIFIKETMDHIRRVQDNMILLEENRERLPFEIKKWRLLQRIINHDATKFSSHLVDGHILVNNFLRNKKLKLSNDHIDMEEVNEAIRIHEELETHHPIRRRRSTRIDLCEICCNLVALSQENNEKDYTKYYKQFPLNEYKKLKKCNADVLKILELLKELNKGK